jgi:hypothetical protein
LWWRWCAVHGSADQTACRAGKPGRTADMQSGDICAGRCIAN